jgi:hypothetical protein
VLVDTLKGEAEKCGGQLDACQAQTKACLETAGQLEKALGQAQAALDDFLADPDMDGVIAARDDCPKTPDDTGVDANGCSADQFCGAVAAGAAS